MEDKLFMQVETKCPFCKKTDYVTLKGSTVTRYIRWCAGEDLIQNLLDDVCVEVREQLISGICPDCWEDTFSIEKGSF